MLKKTKKNKRIYPLFLYPCLILLLTQNVTAKDNTEKTGDVLRVLIPSLALGSTFYLNDKEGRQQFYSSFLTNAAITYALKKQIKKQRPNGEDNDAFPSGHTSVAFQGASFIHTRYGLKYAIPAYLSASYVGYSRITSDQHDEKDVIAGATIGVVSSLYFTKPYKGFTITPTVNKETYGVTLSKQW
jgi:membrane-associated phospholipid phosphatase